MTDLKVNKTGRDTECDLYFPHTDSKIVLDSEDWRVKDCVTDVKVRFNHHLAFS